MDAQQFLAEFGHIANSPNGVARLRELILALAVQGRLVEQLESAESAALQVERIRRIGIERPASGRRKKTNALAAHSFLPSTKQTLPKGWVNVPLCHLARVLNGRAYSKPELLESGTPVLRVGNLFTSDKWYYSNLELEEDKYCDNGDLLYAWSASFGPFIWSGKKVIYHYHIWKLDLFSSTELNKNYLFTYLLEKTQEIKAAGHGISMSHMTKERFEQLSVLLPPLEEQSRIVAKVDELMALCDKLEAQQQARRKLQNKLRQSTLQAVASATSPHELQATWARLADNFGRLFQAPEDVADLRKMASELAIRGALDVFSEPTDTSTVDVYLAELAIGKSGKRFAKSVQVGEDIPLPNGWRWVLLEDLLSDSESGWSPKCEAEPRRDGEWGVLKVSAVTWGVFNPNENKRLPLSLEARPECEVKPGDFMLSRANTAELVARSVIAPADCPEKLLMSDKIVRLIFLDDALKPWVNLVNNSDLARTYYKERATGTSDSMRNVSRQVIHELPIPLPSLKVQERVLLALGRLLRYCDSLEQQAASRMRLSAQLSASAVASLTGIAIEQQEEPMKVPQTELIAPLRLGAAPDIKAQAPLATILTRHNGEMSAKDLWQRFGGEIDAFYAQLKTEVAHGWILEPAPAEIREKPANAVSA
mgnify:CR=1 FL=1